MDTKIIRKLLKEAEPSRIKLDLLPELWFKEDEKDIEYWIFFYAFAQCHLVKGRKIVYNRGRKEILEGL